MDTYDIAKEFISRMRYQVMDDDRSSGHIAFRYQMNTIHFWANSEDTDFFIMTLPNFAEVTEENVSQVKEICHQVNKDAKFIKLYLLNDVLLASAEVYYLAKNDFEFQMKNALRHLIAGKVMYKKIEHQIDA